MKITPLLLVLAPIAAHAGGWQIDTQTDPQTHKSFPTYTATAINESGAKVQFTLKCEHVQDKKIEVTWGRGRAVDKVSYDTFSLSLNFSGLKFKPGEIVHLMWRPIWDEPREGFSPRIRRYNTMPGSERAFGDAKSLYFRDVYTDFFTIQPTRKIAVNVSNFYTDQTWFVETPDFHSVVQKLSSPEFCNAKQGHMKSSNVYRNALDVAQMEDKVKTAQYLSEMRHKKKVTSITIP